VLFASASPFLPGSALADVNIAVNNGVAHQAIEGFGATTISLIYNTTDNVPAPLRARAIDALYNQVRLNMGNLEVGPFESPSSMLYAPANDDGDPNTINAAGFNWTQSDNMMRGVVTPGRVFGLDNFYLGPVISETYEFAWATALRSSNYDLYLDECAEHVAAVAIHWRDAYGITPRYIQLFNEPIGGNRELAGGSIQEFVDIIERTGPRLRREGFSTMSFVVPADETEELSLSEAQAIMADPVARQYVGAIAYHPYPYGSIYASVPNILSTSGSGNPDPGRIAVRNQLRDLGLQYGVPVFMVEVSHSDLAFGDFNGARGRAIQIHDEMVYADVSAFFGMNAMWDSITNDQHYAGRANPGLFAETDTIVLIDDAAGQVYITEMGRAIGHYARFVPRGSVRIDATSDDPLFQVTAFRVDDERRFVLVAINNANAPRTAHVNLAGLSLSSSVMLSGEQSTSAGYWQPINAFAPSAGGYTVTVPPLSITTYTAPLAGATAVDAGAPTVDAGSTSVDGGSPSDASAGCSGAMCGAQCVDLQTDPTNCGACGRAVCHTEVCTNGAPSCAPGRTACGTPFGCLGCKDLREDPANCGMCGRACSVNEVCSQGECVTACAAAALMCGQSCIADPETDVAHCGGCSTVCHPGQYCAAGQCTATPAAGDAGSLVMDGGSIDSQIGALDAASDRADGNESGDDATMMPGEASSDAENATDADHPHLQGGSAGSGGVGPATVKGCGCRASPGARSGPPVFAIGLLVFWGAVKRRVRPRSVAGSRRPFLSSRSRFD
jgi:O-glycosyl hydrolase